jgi:hypothetical protein
MATKQKKTKAKQPLIEPTTDSELNSSSLHLWTTNDITNWRNKLIKEQNGLDPITGEPFTGRVCLDHDHARTGESAQRVRGVLSQASNTVEGKIKAIYYRYLAYATDQPLHVILRNLSEYYQKDNQHLPLHPAWIKTATAAFSGLSEPSKALVLGELGKANAGNSLVRKKLFLDAVKSKKFSYNQLMDLIAKVKS